MFLRLQSCLEDILLCHSRNNYNLPHVGKEAALQTQGLLPILLEAMEQAIEFAIAFKEANGGNVEVEVCDHDGIFDCLLICFHSGCNGGRGLAASALVAA